MVLPAHNDTNARDKITHEPAIDPFTEMEDWEFGRVGAELSSEAIDLGGIKPTAASSSMEE